MSGEQLRLTVGQENDAQSLSKDKCAEAEASVSYESGKGFLSSQRYEARIRDIRQVEYKRAELSILPWGLLKNLSTIK